MDENFVLIRLCPLRPAQILRHRPPFADTLPFCGCSPSGETLFLLRHSVREIAELEYALG